jgi:hypothetical protein
MFLPRSGSTILNELLAYKYQNSNLDEFMTPHSRVRVPIDGLAPRNQIVEDAISHCNRGVIEIPRGLKPTQYAESLHPVFFRMQKERLVKKLIQDGHSISMKDQATPAHPGTDYNGMIRWCIDNNVEMYFTFRRDFEAMLYSLFVIVNRVAHIRKVIADPTWQKPDEDLKHLDAAYATRSDVEYSVDTPPVELTEEDFWRVYRYFVHEVYNFKALYYTYKNYATTICFEDIADTSDFSKAGITPELYNSYNQIKFHMMKTPPYEIGHYITNFKKFKKYYQSMIGFLDDIQ